MTQNTRWISIALIIIAIIAASFLGLYYGPAARASRADTGAKAVLEAFGGKLKNVSLIGEKAAVAKAIEENYSAYVTAELLSDWKANPEHAPGRLTSSPWPARLGVATTRAQGAGRLMTGEVILVTSEEAVGESADTVPFVALLIPTEDGWKIAAYQEEQVQTLKKIPTSDEDIPGAK